jgi:triosephosphate isomerase
MRRKLVAGNWKMNKTLPEAVSSVELFLDLERPASDVDIVLCVPFTLLDGTSRLLRGTNIQLGAQDVFWMQDGAFTGSISASMLSDMGCDYCIVGHSETRGRFGKLEIHPSHLSYFADTNDTVNLKIRALVDRNIKPILCVGETLAERDAGQTDAVVNSQVRECLSMISGKQFANGVVAYEPVWAIGTGKVCDSAEASRICTLIRSLLQSLYGEVADEIRVLYGGSIKPTNAREIFGQPNIDGGLVGGASLDPADFSGVVSGAS